MTATQYSHLLENFEKEESLSSGHCVSYFGSGVTTRPCFPNCRKTANSPERASSIPSSTFARAFADLVSHCSLEYESVAKGLLNQWYFFTSSWSCTTWERRKNTSVSLNLPPSIQTLLLPSFSLKSFTPLTSEWERDGTDGEHLKTKVKVERGNGRGRTDARIRPADGELSTRSASALNLGKRRRAKRVCENVHVME